MADVDSRTVSREAFGGAHVAKLDSTDIRLIGELYQSTSSFGVPRGIKGSLRPVAERLGVDEDTVRNRIRRLEDEGLLQGWQMLYGLGLIGGLLFMVFLDVSPGVPKEEVVRKLRLVRGVVGFVDMFGSGLSVALICENENPARGLST